MSNTISIDWNYSNVEATAALLMRINPHFCFKTLDHAVAAIRRHVEAHVAEEAGKGGTLSYIATYGYCASFWYDDAHNLHVKVTVEPHTVTKYLEAYDLHAAR